MKDLWGEYKRTVVTDPHWKPRPSGDPRMMQCMVPHLAYANMLSRPSCKPGQVATVKRLLDPDSPWKGGGLGSPTLKRQGVLQSCVAEAARECYQLLNTHTQIGRN